MTGPFNSRWQLKTDSLAALAITLAPIFYFLPALLNHRVLGPDDGMLFNVPLRVAAAQMVRRGQLPLWNPYIFSGMPMLAAAQGGFLFPLNWFYLAFSPAVATDLMVISAYMLAAAGAYYFARRTGASIAGAITTSLIWPAGGFLIGQISHINIVHTAAMLPWVLWALERYVSNGRRARGAWLSVLVAVQAFAGHQQTLAYSLILVAAYAIVMALTDLEKRRRYLTSLAYLAAGVLLAAVQIVPTFELLRNSPRAAATYDFFSSFSMPRSFISTFVAPYVMGGGDGRLFRAPYLGQAYYTEYVAYAGVLAIMLALTALLFKPDPRTKFWSVTALVCLILAFGSGAPLYLYRLIYHVPIINLFRVPARHLMEVNFALAMLAGRGLTALGAVRGTKRTSWRVAFVAGAVSLLILLVVTLWRPADFHLGREGPVSLLRAPELFLPIVFAALSSWALLRFSRGRRASTAMLLAVLAIDLVVWGQSSGWYKSSGLIPEEFWSVPETVQLLREKVPRDPASYRIFTNREPFDPRVPAPAGGSNPRQAENWVLWIEPDVYMMYGLHNAAGYDGFGMTRYSELAGQMKLWGELTDPNATLRSNSRELDLLNMRYLLSIRKRSDEAQSDPSSGDLAATTELPNATENYGGFMFGPSDLALPNLDANKRLRFSFPPVEIDHVALLTNLSWAEDVSDNTPVGQVRLKTRDGRTFEFVLRSGVDTADWAFDRPDIRARIRHRHPPVASSYDVSDAQYEYQGHTYVTSLALPEKTAIESGEIELEPQNRSPSLSLGVFRVSLIDASRQKSYSLGRDLIQVESKTAGAEQPVESKDDRWKLVGQARRVDIYENERALPRAWLAPDARVLDDAGMLQVIRTGTLPDGSKWDPLHTALVETELPTSLTTDGSIAGAEITGYEANQVTLQTHANGNSILILGDNDYPGWRAYIDGQAAEVFRVDYSLRGVVIPNGDHQVKFLYRPWSVMGGLLLSLLTATGLIVFSRRTTSA